MASAIPSNQYAFAPLNAALNDGAPIQITSENLSASLAIQEQLPELLEITYPLIVVPGYTPVKTNTPQQLTDVTMSRLNRAVDLMKSKNIGFILVTGGNVHPDGTPFNEAYGMKTYLKDNLGLLEEQIIMDPYARHSTTNLRNAARIMLTHSLNRALIVTSSDQNFYFGFPGISTFNMRSKKDLGYTIGKLSYQSLYTCLMEPNNNVFTRGSDLLDP